MTRLLRIVLVGGLGALLLAPVPVWAAGITVTSSGLGQTALVTPVAYPSSVITANGGSIVGRPEKNDTVTVVFSVQLSQATLCSTWTNSTSTRSLNATVQIADGAAGNDVLTISSVAVSTCATGFHFGSLDLGSAGYVTATRTYTSSTIALTQTAAATTLKITLGTASGSGSTVTGGSAAVYTPDVAVTDVAGNKCSPNLAETAATVQL